MNENPQKLVDMQNKIHELQQRVQKRPLLSELTEWRRRPAASRHRMVKQAAVSGLKAQKLTAP
jgi:hypothetical protein